MRMKTKCLAAILAAALAAGTGAAWGSVDPTVSIAIDGGSFASWGGTPTLLYGSYHFGPESNYSGFSWSDLTVTPSVVSQPNGNEYQLSLLVSDLATTNPAGNTMPSIAFSASDASYTLPWTTLLQGSISANVSNGTSSDSISYSGAVADYPNGSPAAATPPWSEFLQNNTGSEAYAYTDPLDIQGYGIAGSVDITAVGSMAFASGTTVNSLNPVTDVTTPEPATLALFVLGGLALLWPRRKRRKS